MKTRLQIAVIGGALLGVAALGFWAGQMKSAKQGLPTSASAPQTKEKKL